VEVGDATMEDYNDQNVDMVVEVITLPLLASVYWKDYLVVIMNMITLGMINKGVGVYARYIPPLYPDASFPLTTSTVSVGLLMVICLIVPLICFAAHFYFHRSLHTFHHALLGLLTAFSFTLLATEAMKHLAGRQRPDYYARLVDGTPSVVLDGMYSFPSGHSSAAFTTMIYLSCYLSGQLYVFHPISAEVWKLAVVLLPCAVACWIAITRTRDYQHHFEDILGGAMLGVGLSFPSYFLFFPSLMAVDCNKPKSREPQPSPM